MERFQLFGYLAVAFAIGCKQRAAEEDGEKQS
jgi:hypothetical protein